MKICPECNNEFAGREWRCSQCEWTAPVVEGFPILDYTSTGFSSEGHESLARYESDCFWFANRNRLIETTINRFFPHATRFMEVGCGTGFVLSSIAKARRWDYLVGSESSISGLCITRERVPDADLLQMDIRQCHFDREFDLVGAFDVVEHIAEDNDALTSLHRAILPGGGVLLTVPQHMWLWSVQDEMAGHHRRYSRRQLSRALQAAGFEIVYTTSFTTLLLPAFFLSRLSSRWRNTSPKTGTFCELGLPETLNRVFALVSGLERTMIRAGARFPVGGSLLLAARKPSEPNRK